MAMARTTYPTEEQLAHPVRGRSMAERKHAPEMSAQRADGAEARFFEVRLSMVGSDFNAADA
jgi:hypothetical protein